MFDRAHVINRLEEIVAELGPDFVYEGRLEDDAYVCYYRDPETNVPSCGVARVLDKDGLLFLAKTEGMSVAALADINHHYSDEAIVALNIFQNWQDDTVPYGIALEKTKNGIWNTDSLM